MFNWIRQSSALKKSSVLMVLGLCSFSLVAGAAGAVPQKIWSGKSAGYQIEWNAAAIQFSKPGSKFQLQPLKPEAPDPEMPCEYERSLKLLSIVGPIVSYQQGDSWTCVGAAHPGAYIAFQTLDLRQPQKKLLLTDVFAAKDILAALLKEPVIKQTLTRVRPPKPIQTLAQLSEHLQANTHECEYAFESDWLERFAFDHLKGDQVAVRLGLSHGCEAARGRLTQLGIYLPLPAAWKGPFKQASARQAGFLMQHAPDNMAAAKQTNPGYEAAWKKLMEN